MNSATPPLHLLLPAQQDLPPDPEESLLADLYAHPATRHVRVNMVASIDGGAWGDDGRSGSINDAADWRVFRVLRAMADVVLVGAGTARAESYTALDRPRGLEHLSGAPLELALVTRQGKVPASVLAGSRTPWILTGSTGAPAARAAVGEDRTIIVPTVDGELDLGAGLQELAAYGLGRVLAEGGPHLLASMLHADLVDQLCVTTTPQLVGPGPGRIVAGPTASEGTEHATTAHVPAAHLRSARLGHLLAAPAGTLLARWELRG